MIRLRRTFSGLDRPSQLRGSDAPSAGLSFYAVPALWWLSIAPHFIAAGISKASKDVPDFTNVSPRVWTIKVRVRRSFRG